MATTERKLKCKECGKYFTRDMLVTIAGANYCPDCAPRKRVESNANIAINALWVKLCDGDTSYIPRFNKEINLLKEEYKCSSVTILKVLQYAFSSDNPPNFNPDSGVSWLIRSYYPKAKKYYQGIEKLKASVAQQNILEKINQPPKEIEISSEAILRTKLELEQRTLDEIYGPLIDITTITEEN